MPKHVPPSIDETAFNCPHCGALTTQYWFELFPAELESDRKTPFIPNEDNIHAVMLNQEIGEDDRRTTVEWIREMEMAFVFMERISSMGVRLKAHNIYLSQCYNCSKLAVWVHDKLLFPAYKTGVQPNSDMPNEIVKDFEEARAIVDKSPRGAAALLRLCVQKLCVTLGEKGKNIDDDIGSLVQKGLSPLIQKSLDIVRVVGNEAVHPGTLDLKDDRRTALSLFNIVNAVCEQMITHPKHVNALFEKLPEAKRAAIKNRDLRK